MKSIKKFFSKFLNRHPLIKKVVSFVDRIDNYTNKPFVYLTFLVTLGTFFLVVSDVVTIKFSAIKFSADLGKYLPQFPGVLGSIFPWILLWGAALTCGMLLVRFALLVAGTWTELRSKDEYPVSMEIIIGWALIIGVSVGGGGAQYLKHSAKQSEAQKKLESKESSIARKQSSIDWAVKTCQSFPDENICKVVGEDRDWEWAGDVNSCFSRKDQLHVMSCLPDACTPTFGFREWAHFNTPIAPPEILATQVREGEALASAITAQTIAVAGELWAVDYYPRFATALSWKGVALECLPWALNALFSVDMGSRQFPAAACLNWDRSGESSEEGLRAGFIRILSGEVPSKTKSAIESELGVRIGLSQQLDQLTEDQKRGVGIVIGIYNHLLKVHEGLVERSKEQIERECAEYAPDALRPSRCFAYKHTGHDK